MVPSTSKEGKIDRLYILDGGVVIASDKSVYTPGKFKGEPISFTCNVYLMQRKGQWILWDTGIEESIFRIPGGKVIAHDLRGIVLRTLTEQLADIDLKPEDINMVILSHAHFDHVGNAHLFRNAKWYIQADEYKAMFGPDHTNYGFDPGLYKDLKNSDVEQVPGDLDVFGDGSVKIMATPGHTPGHKGSTLEMTDGPDTVADHVPDFCDRCGNGLSGIAGEQVARRQVVDIPPVVPHYTEHRVLRRECTCGNLCEGPFPENVRAPISYGPNVQAAVAYLHTRQYLPVGRTAELLGDFCGLPMSQGTIINILKSFTAKSAPAYGPIARKVKAAKAVGTDETGIKVDGNKGWYWAWQYGSATYIVFSDNRGIATIDANFPSGLPGAVLVHDCWASHFRTACRTHQLCTAHLLRELVYFTERYASFRFVL